MEGKLCHCGKGKAREPFREVSPVLGSPLVLGWDIPEESGSDDSYHTLPVASSLIPSLSSPVVKSNEENVMVLYNSRKSLVEIVDSPKENTVPLLIPEPVLDFAGISRLIAVCGQCVVHSQGRLRSQFHPYTNCCHLG